MQNCWLANPKDRPNFIDIGKDVEEILSGYTEYLDLGGKSVKADCPDVPAEIVCSPLQLAEREKGTPNSYPDYRDPMLASPTLASPTLASPTLIYQTDH